jgi:prevent-host-death family protein
MHSVGAFEAKTHFSAILDNVEKGQEMFITKHGRVVAKLSPVGFNKAHLKAAVENIQTFQNTHKLTLDLDWKVLRDEGRK